MAQVEDLQHCFVLHTRAWRETSLIVEVFSERFGLIGLCAKGVKNKKFNQASILQPLTPLLLKWKGRGELPLLTHIETVAPAIKLSSDALFSSFYINELLLRLLHRHDPHPNLFRKYHRVLTMLAKTTYLEPVLREFELHLLMSIGYGLSFREDVNGDPVETDKNYFLDAEGRFHPINDHDAQESMTLFQGQHLLSIADNKWENKAVLTAAKKLSRMSFRPLLGERPLQSRKLFRRKHNV